MSSATKYLDSMAADVADQEGRWTRAETEEWASRYWQIRHDKTLSDEQIAEKLVEHCLEFRDKKNVWVNERGNTVIDRHKDTERYWWDFDDEFRADGWLQFDTDQDAWYFGVWVNPKQLRTLTYAEGDVTLVLCPDVEHYNAEIRACCDCYGEGFEMLACNGEGAQQVFLGGKVPGAEIDVYRQDRSEFTIQEKR